MKPGLPIYAKDIDLLKKSWATGPNCSGLDWPKEIPYINYQPAAGNSTF